LEILSKTIKPQPIGRNSNHLPHKELSEALMLSKVFLFQSYVNKSFPHYFCMQHCYFTVQWPKQHYSALHAVRCRMQTPCCPGSRLKHWGIPLNNILHIIYVLLSIRQKAREDWRVKTSLTCVWKYLVQISTERERIEESKRVWLVFESIWFKSRLRKQ